MMTGYIFSVFI